MKSRGYTRGRGPSKEERYTCGV